MLNLVQMIIKFLYSVCLHRESYFNSKDLTMKLFFKKISSSVSCTLYARHSEKTFDIALARPLHASDEIAKPDEVPIAYLNCSMNHFQFSVVSESKTT
jgi:hypothetical protein